MKEYIRSRIKMSIELVIVVITIFLICRESTELSVLSVVAQNN